ncbi:PREDICTED: uncharacterized protein LOC106812585 [Priapulus caudatus]|uniref:Uncharacterized protein LOC106812585 n=1 Tax=Priapulus caudatus TaxID=37621 RepID=A0ABM1EIF6_PRICU|nr:PREDICTED: uncharacterized protein LOC106812585 [Priapulus caudatus]
MSMRSTSGPVDVRRRSKTKNAVHLEYLPDTAKVLNLSGAHLRPDAFKFLKRYSITGEKLHTSSFRLLHTLDLSECRFSEADLCNMCERCGMLRTLRLNWCQTWDNGTGLLLTSKLQHVMYAHQHLIRLEVRGILIERYSRFLARMARKLEHLDMGRTLLAAKLPATRGDGRLRSLSLRGCWRLDDRILRSIARCAPLSGLRSLDVRDTPVTPDGVAAFSKRFPDCSVQHGLLYGPAGARTTPAGARTTPAGARTTPAGTRTTRRERA